MPARGSEDAAKRVVQLVTDSIPRVFACDADQIQVVTPVHRGPAGTQALNRALKAVLNPGTGTVRGFDDGRPGRRHRQSPRRGADRLRQRRGGHGAVLRGQLAAGGLHRR